MYNDFTNQLKMKKKGIVPGQELMQVLLTE